MMSEKHMVSQKPPLFPVISKSLLSAAVFFAMFFWLFGVQIWPVQNGPVPTGPLVNRSAVYAASTQMPTRPNDRLEERLHGILAVQQNAWNQGDIRQFMDAYWNDEALTFSSGGTTTRGWQATYERYKSRYPDRAAMGQLTFDALETSQIDEQAALTLGNWKLDKDKPARGNFSLVWKRIDGQWKIVHDHSSLLTEPN
jgi:ketosteroid isomerase-like protein